MYNIADKIEIAYYDEIMEAQEDGVSGYAVSGYAYATAKGLAHQEGALQNTWTVRTRVTTPP